MENIKDLPIYIMFGLLIFVVLSICVFMLYHLCNLKVKDKKIDNSKNQTWWDKPAQKSWF